MSTRPSIYLARQALLLASALAASVPAQAAGPADGPPPFEVEVINGCHLWPYAQCPGVDLRHANLARKDLRGVNFRGARLHRADLRFANLAGANLDGADLTGVKGYALNAPGISFVQARLVAADFEMARFFRANFSGADLTSASLEAAKMNYVWFNGARIVNANLQETKFVASNFDGAILEGNFLKYTIFPDANFENCQGCPTDNWKTP